jgi:hypothetical protein
VKLQRLGRGLGPGAFVLAGFLLAAPFVTVSCDAPGGYGRAAPGGATSYTGLDLVTGGRPTVSSDHLRPADHIQPDTIGPQPLAIILLALLAAGAVTAIVLAEPRRRRGAVTVMGGAAVGVLLLNQAVAHNAVEQKLVHQLTVPMPVGHTAKDYVHTGAGFLWCLLVLVVLTVANLIVWRRTRTRPSDPGALQPDPSLPTAVDPNAAP